MMVTAHSTVLDPDLEIREGGRHPDPEVRGGGWSPKNIFQTFQPQFGLKIRGGLAPPMDPPLQYMYLQVNPHVSRCKSSHNAGPVG